EARALAQAQGLTVIDVQAPRQWWLTTPVSRGFPLLAFCQSLLILLDAGLSVVEAIETLAEREQRADERAVLRTLLGHLREGLALSAAMERQGEIFAPLFIATVRANERTGALAEAIGRYVAYRAQADQMRKRVIGASIYPAMILAVGALVIAFLLAY